MGRRVLLAAPPDVIRDLGPALAECLELSATETFDEAISRLHAEKPDMVVVCYAFDDVRPFRLLHYMQQEWQAPEVPIMLIRALPVSMGQAAEAQILEAYNSLGVFHFFNLWDQAAQHGMEEALRRFRESVLAQLSTGKNDSTAPGAD